VVGCCEHGNEPSDSIKSGEFLDELRNYQVVQTDCAFYGVSLLHGGQYTLTVALCPVTHGTCP
jgi:hypothetical protein